ncbi:aminoacyl-histidine dipeptidase [Thiotrichales bacterium 19S9-12]|nr:aminoacyl-histidine dipeptidase [Thiotrichales bacterium 19S9-11]MCF6811397.1 aminoacyl-histidine dipeptidase [Thiotrichales bacterium 19S9-12]
MFSDLAYPQVWNIFDQIRQTPRPSFKEEAIRKYIYQWADQYQFKIIEDSAHNLVIYIPATEGYEDADTIAMQGHLDMVCEKHSDKIFNFETDAIEIIRDGNWIKANGTTLGADNGIGVALMMASAIDPKVTHGPLEILLTATEEKGLVGARNLETGLLNAKYMINIDSETWGEFTIGCAGGGDSLIELPVESVKSNPDNLAYNIKISGLKGGHSGIDIHKPHGNAIKILSELLETSVHIKIAEIQGGNLRNAIPREAQATILLDAQFKEDILKQLNKSFEKIKPQLVENEPNISLTVESLDALPNTYLKLNSQHTLLTLIHKLPHGVVSMDPNIESLVETSSNLASIKHKNNTIHIAQSTRSSDNLKLQQQRDNIRTIATKYSANVKEDEAYPGWQPNPHSEIVNKTLKAYEMLFNEKAHIAAIHAGLECGIINGKYPDIQMISFGPDIQGAHSPDERLDIPSTIKCYDFLKSLLTMLANESTTHSEKTSEPLFQLD